MAKSAHDSHTSVLKDSPGMKKEKEEKQLKLLVGTKQAEASARADLGGARSASARAPTKTLAYSTNPTSGESTTTASALLPAGGGS